MIDWGFDRDVYIEEEIPFRGDHYMLEVTSIFENWGPPDSDGVPTERCDPIFEFQLFQYSELRMDYSQPITEDLTADENLELQHRIHDLYIAQLEREAEAWEERRRER